MRSVGRVTLGMVALGFALPALSHAQAVQPANLVGVWEGIPGVDPQSPKDTTASAVLTKAVAVRSDSTWSMVVFRGVQKSCLGGSWRLAGDSIFWQFPGGVAARKIVLKNQDQQFFAYRWTSLTTPAEAYRRADTTKTPKPKHLAALPQCSSTARPAVPPVPAPSASDTPAAPRVPTTPSAPKPPSAPKQPSTPGMPTFPNP